MNTVAIDKTDGCTIYFPRSVIETLELRTSKCSDLNVSFPSKDDEQEWLEKPIPEQYCHRIVDEGVKTTVSDLYCCPVCWRSVVCDCLTAFSIRESDSSPSRKQTRHSL